VSVPLPKTDVVIVGMGAAGGTAAYVLAEAGLKVVGLEAGPRMNEEDFLAKLDELGTYEYRNWMGESKVNHENPTWRPDEDTPAGPIAGIRMMNAVGGTSIHWGAQSWRLREDDFLVRSTTVEKYGEEALPEGSAIEDWGITYDELEPYYDKAEYAVGVAGKGGSNPFESPRSRDYPMPPSQPFEMGEVFEKAMSGLGYHPFPIPSGFTTVEYNGRPACSYCGMCSGYGCWNNSKTSAHVTVIPAAEATGNLEVRPNSRVLRVITDAGGNASGVEYLDEHGTLKVQPASVVIVATYTYENTRLLLTSANEEFPNGLANNSGQVGKYFMTHSIAGANGYFPGKHYAPWAGTSGQGVAIDDLNGDNFDHTGLGFIRGGFVSIASGGSGPISLSRNLPPGVPRWGAEYKRWLSENTGTIAGVTMLFDVMPYEHNFLDLDPKKVDRQGVPVIRITYRFGENEAKASDYFTKKMEEIVEAAGAEQTWSFGAAPYPLFSHAYGGTRMGVDPSKSVVDKYGRTHEVPNLFVLGASTHASSSGYNPTETVFAHSWFAAEYLAKNFKEIGV
jgi:gluconate 2-dehydrogenase alpha chain